VQLSGHRLDDHQLKFRGGEEKTLCRESNCGPAAICLSWLSCLVISWLKREARSVVSESNFCVALVFVIHSRNFFVVLEEVSISNELQSNCFT
jgi:hypothetical protein